MKCIIVDDEHIARSILRELAKQIKEIEIVEEFSNAIQAIKFLNKNDIDVLFLDIHMPDFTGFDLIETLKKPPKIVLTTSDRDLAVEAFEYESIVDYLVKPIAPERFHKAIERVKKANLKADKKQTDSSAVASQEESLFVNIDRRLVNIHIPSINVVEAKGDYIRIKTEQKNYIVHSPLKKIEEKLPQDTFLKVHRSFIINIEKIIDIEDNSVLIQQDVIPVSRSNRNELKRRLNLL